MNHEEAARKAVTTKYLQSKVSPEDSDEWEEKDPANTCALLFVRYPADTIIGQRRRQKTLTSGQESSLPCHEGFTPSPAEAEERRPRTSVCLNHSPSAETQERRGARRETIIEGRALVQHVLADRRSN